jgi:hypothetical protein
MGLLAAHYFDDSTIVEVRRLAATSKALSLRAAKCCGIVMSAAKRIPMLSVQRFLGRLTDMSQPHCSVTVTVGLDVHVRQKVCDSIANILESGRLSPAEASKLRGSVQWM